MLFKVHVIHVGNMNNKGTQALLESDVSVIRSVVKTGVVISVSTTDVEGVKRLHLPLEVVLPTTIDIPYEVADLKAKRLGFRRTDVKYKAFAAAFLINVFFQAVFSMLSVILVRLGLEGFYRSDLLKQIKNCDLVVSCSDENFKEGTSQLPLNIYWIITWWTLLFSRTWEISMARFLKKPVVLFPNSIGPFRTCFGRFLSRLSLNCCDYLLIRDAISYRTVDLLGITSPKILTMDTALLFNLHTSNHQIRPKNFSHPAVGVCPGIYSHSVSDRKLQKYINDHAKALDTAIEKHGMNVVFLPHYVSGFPNDDLRICRQIQSRMKNKERTSIQYMDDVKEFKSMLDEMDIIIASKMHPAVLAVTGYVPTLCIVYDHKQIGFFKALGMEQYAINLNDFSSSKLICLVDIVWSNRKAIRSHLKKTVTLRQDDVRNAIQRILNPYLKTR